MGAWAEGVFDNDTVGDWADELARSDRDQNVADALTAVIQGSLGIDECSEALVAAARSRLEQGRACAVGEPSNATGEHGPNKIATSRAGLITLAANFGHFLSHADEFQNPIDFVNLDADIPTL